MSDIVKKCFLLLSLFSFNISAEVSVYYGKLEKLSGYQLKTALAIISIKHHQELSYNELIDIFFQSDRDTTYENDGTLRDIYSENPREPEPYIFTSRSQKCGNYKKESDCFNREHLFPQSIFNEEYPMKSDIHHVFPTDGHVNSKRYHYPFGEVKNPEWSSKNGSKLGLSSSKQYKATVFEPIDEFKGDIARAMFYFATRYENRIAYWKDDMLNGTSDQVYTNWFLETLLKWHRQDPVDPHEINRNNIAEFFQGNRNPFIDHPEWVEMIWSFK